MAEGLRLALFVLSLAFAGAAFFWLDSFWAYLAPVLILAAGGVFAKLLFRRVAEPTEESDLDDGRREPPP
ncbi:MAG TPA: hypothetical protein VIZ90_14380 [Rhizobiaceae bacterium]